MIDKKEIKKQAKQIMDDFIKALDKVKEKDIDFGTEREESTRTPDDYKEDGFKDRMLKNAPKKKGDYVLMEKKSW
ncbi:MAG: hypothetical protein GY861_26655 [bacterium]|nr:hypothetical protein [bacterium]